MKVEDSSNLTLPPKIAPLFSSTVQLAPALREEGTDYSHNSPIGKSSGRLLTVSEKMQEKHAIKGESRHVSVRQGYG